MKIKAHMKFLLHYSSSTFFKFKTPFEANVISYLVTFIRTGYYKTCTVLFSLLSRFNCCPMLLIDELLLKTNILSKIRSYAEKCVIFIAKIAQRWGLRSDPVL